jgi:ABC-2 type transport system ATP-binding protein
MPVVVDQREAPAIAGRLLAAGTPESLRAGSDLPTMITFGLPPAVPPVDLPPLSAPLVVSGTTVRLTSREPVADSWRLTGWASERGIALPDFTVSPPTLEDVYLALTEESPDGRPA